MLPQPDDVTCGPTCLHAVYRYYDDELPLAQVIAETPMLTGGGTLAVHLGRHALGRGYRAKIYTFNLQVFDPTWFASPRPDLAGKLAAQRDAKRSPKLRAVCDAYIDFLGRGGRIVFRDLSRALLRRHLLRGAPILTGLSATYLYRSARERSVGPRVVYDDVRGTPSGHFVVLSGYDVEARTVRVADPYLPNPVAGTHYYDVSMARLISAIHLGILTYDANLLVLQPRADVEPDRR